jgi:hypothetical protein
VNVDGTLTDRSGVLRSVLLVFLWRPTLEGSDEMRIPRPGTNQSRIICAIAGMRACFAGWRDVSQKPTVAKMMVTVKYSEFGTG